jgi:monoamine oxidase
LAFDYDVLIIGAGAAGLAAAQDLSAAGLRFCCLEARDRIGGRILTVHDAATSPPIELGAEFVHGKPTELFDLADSADLHLYQTGGRPVSLTSGGHDTEEDGFLVLEDVANSATEENDETFQAFLDRSQYSPAQKHQASAFVEGFNAARRDVIGTASLAKDQRAADAIDGDRAFRIHEGYEAFIHSLARGVDVRLNSVVEAIAWKPGSATVRISGTDPLRARQVIITVPLSVLQAGAIRFDPAPAAIPEAIHLLRFGDAFRVTFLFDRAFWEDNRETAYAGFLFSDEPLFPVWWTGLPAEPRAITAWSAGPKADALIGLSADDVIARARETLSRLLKTPTLPTHRAWFHDWHADPFARGAYSYVPARALPARRTLAEPLDHTLYFAGEHTDLLGYGGTVHGAIASGRRAAQQIIRS